MNISDITILGTNIPPYGLCIFTGIAVASVLALIMALKLKQDIWDFVGMCAYILIGSIIGSKLLFLAVTMKKIIEENIPLISVLRGGFVFYGGLIGGAVGIWIYSKQFKVRVREFVNIIAVVTPLAHAFGRLGCLIGGCCYGVCYDGPFCRVYTHSPNLMTPLNTPLFPVQGLEACCLIILFALLVTLYFKYPPRRNKLPYIYMLSYAAIRFSDEFLRGDAERGIYFGLSIAQWISLAVWIAFAAALIIKKKNNRKKKLSE